MFGKVLKYPGLFKYPDAVAYITYLSIFRILTYPEPVVCSEPFQRFHLFVSFRILCNPSIFRICGIFRTLSNISDGAFLRKQLTPFSRILTIPLIWNKNYLPLKRFHKILIPLFNLHHTFQMFLFGRLINFPGNLVPVFFSFEKLFLFFVLFEI